jgi:hypothetical protein
MILDKCPDCGVRRGSRRYTVRNASCSSIWILVRVLRYAGKRNGKLTRNPAGLGGLGALAFDDRRGGAAVAHDQFAICYPERVGYPKWPGQTAADSTQDSENRAACSSTVSVAFSCLSGG